MSTKRRVYPRQQIETLQQQVDGLKSQLRSLEEQQAVLLEQCHVLACCCDVLHCLRTGAMHKDWSAYRNSWLPAELPLLQDLGVQLDNLHLASTCLQQHQECQEASATRQRQQRQRQASRPHKDQQERLSYEQELQEPQPCSSGTDSPSSSLSDELPFARALGPMAGDAAAAAAAAAAADATRVFVTADGPLGPFKASLLQPPYPGADSWSLQDLVTAYSATVKEMAFNLTLLSQQQERGDGSTAKPLQTLQSLVMQHCRKIITILLLHPEDIINKFRIVNLETMELSDNTEQAWQRACWVAAKLDLSKQQRLSLVAAADLFKRLLDTLRAERLQLSAQQALQAGERLPSGRAMDLAAQEQTANRLQLLVRKERFLLTCASGVVCSILDVVQLSRACVMTWPWVTDPGLLPAIVAAAAAQHNAHSSQGT